MRFEQRATLQATQDEFDDFIGFVTIRPDDNFRRIQLQAARGKDVVVLTLDADAIRRMIDNAQNAHGRA